MIESRRRFLTTFFAALEANGVRYCLLRNYENLYAAADTDVDMIVSEYSLERFEHCLREAAGQTDFHFVHSARYVNYSYVFWHRRAGFVRIDFETDVRWRFFTVMSAREILDRRQRYQEFFVPHPEDESAVLYVAAIWRNLLSDRYRNQLAALHARCLEPAALERRLVQAFGRAGRALAAFQAAAATASFDRRLARRVRWSLALRTHWRWARFKTLLVNLLSDLLRLWNRVQRPAGVSLLFVSAHAQPRGLADLTERIHFLFPVKKGVIRSFDYSTVPGVKVNWGIGLRGLRLRTLFKGGLFVRTYRLAQDGDLPRVLRTHARHLYPARTFVCGEDSAGSLYFAHVGSGFMTTSPAGPAASDQEFSEKFIHFISAILERSSDPATRKKRRRGLFCVLVGLDGSGKTTLARNLCDVANAGGSFNGVRYSHWRPKTLRPVELPLPEFKNQPRKAPLPPNTLNTLLSALRLAKNILLVRIAWQLRIRRALKRGWLVLVDRYHYNYQLDPASVKYAGPAWLVRFAQKFFPRPDAVITLRAPAEMLLQRKQELSPEEITIQARRLEQLEFGGPQIVAVDASLPADEIARRTMKRLALAATER